MRLPSTLYAAKCYWPGVTERELRLVAARAVAEAAIASMTGSPIDYVGSLLFAGDELVLCLFETASPAVVRATADRAGMPCERVMDSHWLPGPAVQPSSRREAS